MARSAQSGMHADRKPSSPERLRIQPSVSDAPPQASSSADTAPKTSVTPTSIQAIGAAIAWLSGAVAGLAAIFYAIGFVATLSYVQMLGVDLRSLRYDYTFYVQRGGFFFATLIGDTAQPLLFALLASLAVVFTFLGCSWCWRKLAIGSPFRRFSRHRPEWRGIAILGLLVLLLIQIRILSTYPEEMNVSGILQSAAQGPSAPGSIARRILSGDSEALRGEFVERALRGAWVCVLFPLAWLVSRGRSWAVLVNALFALVLATSLLYLAWDYGMLRSQIKFLEASMLDENITTKLYLLNQIETGYIFWDCSQERTRWLPIDKDSSLTFVKERRTLEQIIRSCNGPSQ